MRTDRTRVVITGMGVLTPLGEAVGEYWDGLVQGKSGIGPLTLCGNDTANVTPALEVGKQPPRGIPGEPR